MSKIIVRHARRFSAASLVAAAFVLVFLATSENMRSADPTNGALAPTATTATQWDGNLVAGGASATEQTCVNGTNCDVYTLVLSGTPADWTGKKAHINVSWTNGNDDYDVFVHKGGVSGPIVGSSAESGGGPEVIDLDPNIASIGTGTFTVRVVYFLVAPTDNYHAEATVVAGAAATPTPSPGATPTATPLPPGTPRFANHVAPGGYGEDSGEPSIGSNWVTENVARAPGQAFGNTFVDGTPHPIPNGGTANYYGGFGAEMLRVTFDDCTSPATPFWEKKPLVLASTPRGVGDPILHTNPLTGRTFVSQEESAAGSTTDVTDNDGDTFMPSQGAGAFSGFDHQTIASGPYSGTPPPTASYSASGPKIAVYYAAQNVSDARVSRSDDGGITFLPSVPMYTTADCGGLHGHIKVAPDGTVYVPNNACGGSLVGTNALDHADGQQAAIVSEDNGVTWHIRPIPGTDTKSDRDPSIGIATDGTVYMGMQSKDGHARIAVSHNKGVDWSTPVDVGVASANVTGPPVGGINNIVFPAVVAGDPDRAAFAFYGSTTAGNNYHCGLGESCTEGDFTGVWYLYIATTFDGGQTWTTINATPNDPVQRGGICGSTTAECRNLLDFFDATVDKRGRILVGWDDGCVGGCVNGGPNSYTTKATITRQIGGKRLFAAYDPTEPNVPGAPGLTGNASPTAVKLSWTVPDNGASEITAYNVYRRVGTSGAFTLIATVPGTTFTDTTFDNSQQNYYRVTAVNAIGEGPFCQELLPTVGPVESACTLPGIRVIDDTINGADSDSAQNTPVDPRVNIRQVYVAEPFVSQGVDRLDFTMQLAPSTEGSAPPNSQWFIVWNRQGTDSNDANDAHYDRMYIAMRTDALGTPSFEYGKWGLPLPTDGSHVPNGDENTPSKRGDADSGSYNPLTGVLRIAVSNSKFRAIDGGNTKYVAGTSLTAINARTYFNRPDPGQRSQNNASDITSDSSYTLVGNNSCAPVAEIARAASRKVHGTETFDIRLVPKDAGGGIEPRTGGSGGNYQVVVTFTTPVTFTGVSASNGASAGTNPTANSAPTNEVTVNLANVPNAKVTNITLAGVSAGGAGVNLQIPLAVLIGDVNVTGRVDGNDVSKVQGNTRRPVDDENFRCDVNANGVIEGNDVSTVQGKTRTRLP